MINNIKNQTGRSLYLNCTKDTQSSFEQRVPNRYTSKRVASRFAQIGRSMIEMLGVLAIIGVLSVGGIAGYSKAMMKYRVNKTIDQITTLSTNITTLFGNQNDFEHLRKFASQNCFFTSTNFKEVETFCKNVFAAEY